MESLMALKSSSVVSDLDLFSTIVSHSNLEVIRKALPPSDQVLFGRYLFRESLDLSSISAADLFERMRHFITGCHRSLATVEFTPAVSKHKRSKQSHAVSIQSLILCLFRITNRGWICSQYLLTTTSSSFGSGGLISPPLGRLVGLSRTTPPSPATFPTTSWATLLKTMRPRVEHGLLLFDPPSS